MTDKAKTNQKTEENRDKSETFKTKDAKLRKLHNYKPNSSNISYLNIFKVKKYFSALQIAEKVTKELQIMARLTNSFKPFKTKR